MLFVSSLQIIYIMYNYLSICPCSVTFKLVVMTSASVDPQLLFGIRAFTIAHISWGRHRKPCFEERQLVVLKCSAGGHNLWLRANFNYGCTRMKSHWQCPMRRETCIWWGCIWWLFCSKYFLTFQNTF